MTRPKYGNVLLKLSGEVLAGSGTGGFDPHFLSRISKEIKSVVDDGVTVGMMVGGGNGEGMGLGGVGGLRLVVVVTGIVDAGRTAEETERQQENEDKADIHPRDDDQTAHVAHTLGVSRINRKWVWVG